MGEPGELPREVNARVPNDARLCDFALGGKDNYEVDRRAARALTEVVPAARRLIPEGHAFRHRALRALLGSGIRQFLDLGCGMPAPRDVHEIVHEADPGAAVVYVDLDPVVISHRQALPPARRAPVTAVQADVRRPGTILEHSLINDRLDLAEPVGLLLTGVLHLVGDEHDPEGIVAAFRDGLAAGSHLVLSDLTDDYRSRGVSPQAWMDENFAISVTLRSRERLAGLFDGFELLAPGLVSVPEWRPDGPYEAPTGLLAGGVGRRF